jgi:hypothetical protein
MVIEGLGGDGMVANMVGKWWIRKGEVGGWLELLVW